VKRIVTAALAALVMSVLLERIGREVNGQTETRTLRVTHA
jgi:hypothetical protein